MSVHVCVLGIDGSGKSTVAAALPAVLAAESDVVAGSAGEGFCLVTAGEDRLAPGFYPDGLPLSARLAIRFKRGAKRHAESRRLYPVYKLAHLIAQDQAAQLLARRYGAQVMVSDGNLLLSTMGRAGNYRRPASEGIVARVPSADDLRAAFAHLLDGVELPADSRAVLPPLDKARRLQRLLALLRIHPPWLPDVVIFLDLLPEEALSRVRARGERLDAHENLADLRQAREGYLRTLEAVSLYRPAIEILTLPVGTMTPGEALTALVGSLQQRIVAETNRPVLGRVLGTTEELSALSFARKLLTYNYLVRYMLAHFFQGAWREPAFIASRLGRLLLKEGYSAGVMKAIYDQDETRPGLFDRIFLGYPLHRAVYDRLQLLTGAIEPLLAEKLSRGGVRIFTAPSGYAYDLFRPLEQIAARTPALMRDVHLLTADLDPHGVLEAALSERAAKLGIGFTFIRGDLTKGETRNAFGEYSPFDLALFVGLSGWLPKDALVSHFRWMRENLRSEGVCVTDCFTPGAYSLAGRYAGYQAHYYTPQVYTAILDYAGLDGLHARAESGRNEINHVVLAAPR